MKILVLTSSTGGGHNMRARSFAQWAEQESRLRTEIGIHEALASTHGLYRFGVNLYNFIQRTYPRLHHIYFNYLEVAGMFSSAEKIQGAKNFLTILDVEQPDVVLSVHGSTNHGFFQLAHKHLGPGKVKCVTYCGELFGGYGFSRHWVNPDADLFIGAVEETCEAAYHLHMPEGKIWRGGFMLNPTFWKKPMSEEARKLYIKSEFGFDPEQFILVLGTGAAGANNHISFLEALRKAKLSPQVLALCGTSNKTFNLIETWAAQHPSFKVKAMPYTDDMARILQCASAIVARPGTGTTSEAIISGCPIIFNAVGGIMPQEYITIKYARKHGISQIVRKASDLSAIVRKLMEESAQMGEIKRRMSVLLPDCNPVQVLEKIISISRS